MLKELLSPKPAGKFDLDRCKALADGVFAIVVTLLVLGIDVPANHHFSEDGLYRFLQRIGFDLLIYAISFWLAGTYWVQHAAIMRFFRQGSRMMVWLNLLFLFFVTLLPFVTKLKGVYRADELVILLFGLVQIFIGLSLVALWRYAASHAELLSQPIDEDLQRSVTWRMLVSPVLLSVAAIPAAYLSVHLSSLLFLSIPLYYMSHRLIDRGSSDSETGEQ